MDPLAHLDAVAQAELVQRGEVKPVELVDAAIARVESTNPELNAVTAPLFGKARAQALAADPPHGCFPGVPILLQDLGSHSAGDPHHAGMRVLRDLGWTEAADAGVVARLRAAGFAFLGKANTTELGLLPATEPNAYGATRNPWKADHSAGGSSGGSAAAVAAGLTPVAHATDAGGSLRISASHCGLVGLKPSRGRVALAPGLVERWCGLWVEHVVSRSVRDTAALLDVLCGSWPGDIGTAPASSLPFSRAAGVDPEPLRIGFMAQGPRETAAHPDCVSAASHAARLLASYGHHIEESHPAALDDPDAMGPLATAVMTAIARELDVWSEKIGRALRESDVEPLTWRVAGAARKRSAAQYLAALEFLNAHARRLVSWWDDDGFDLLLCPTSAEPPAPLGEFQPEPGNPFAGFVRAAAIAAFTSPWNLTGQPAISLPLQVNPAGLPIGVQLVAAYGRDDLLLRVAGQLERHQPWRERVPAIHA